MAITVKLHSLTNATPAQRAFTEVAVELLAKAINDKRFAEKVRSARYTVTWNYDGDLDRQVAPADVLRIIQEGVETGTERDFEIDLHIKYEWMLSAMGKTAVNRFPIRTNTRYLNDWIADEDPAALAAHLMHEWLHVAGFYHRGGNDARDDVAYVVGEIVYDILRNEG